MDFNPLDIIERPEILDIIANTIDEEVGSSILPPDGDLVAIAFALPDRCAGRVAKNIANILKRLIIKLFAGHHRNGLRRINQRRIGFQACAADRDITFFLTGYDDLLSV